MASRIAEHTGDRLVPITECIKASDYNFDDSSIGIVSPTYYWGLPIIVKEFLEKANLNAEYIYFIATYGTTPGASGGIASRALKNNTISAYFSVRMPDTWTPVFDLSTPEATAKFTGTTEDDIDYMIERVKANENGNFMKKRLPYPAAAAWYLFYDSARKTKHLSVDDNCIGCGLCARKCPINAIEMQNGKPIWVKEQCVMCLGCLHRCPKFAINYSKNTKKHGQYKNPNVNL